MVAKSVKFILALVVCGALAFPVISSATPGRGTPWTFEMDTAEAFAGHAAELRKEMGADGQYGGISLSDRNAVEADLDKIDGLLRKRGAASKLSDAEQVDLMSAQERINALLTKNDGNRLICKMEPRTGTKFKVKICRTAAEYDAIRRKSQQGFQDTLMSGAASHQRGN